ncbi:MAG: FAD-dependent oxidoreductase, partial [Mucilaginibacter sp.]|nr:FAD-dependent oxidoreductase [Mucilaginibacter sp.]
MTKETEIVCPPGQHEDEAVLKQLAASALNIPLKNITALKIIKRSIDARGRRVVYRMQVKVFMQEAYQPEIFTVDYPNVQFGRPVIIVGAGPAGLFAALQCIELGLKPVVIERGKDVKQRRRDLANINKQGLVNPESNYCFGEGGAGTYSDGKLYTRSTKRGDVNQVLKMFVAHGAAEDILIDARPHIGTNKLPQIITAMRETVLNAGGEIMFDTKVTQLLVDFGKIKGVKISSGEKIMADAVILATGHSARDVFEMLHGQNILIEAKPFALGVRIEHPQEIIDRAQYHCEYRGPDLPPS